MKRIILTVVASLAFAAGVLAQPTVFTRGVVAADHEIASRAGAEILARGGNAVDAAIATSFTLSVVRPMSCGIGGGGFMLIHDPDAPDGARTVALNYRETAPAAITPDYFVNHSDPDASRYTGAAAGVPGTVSGLFEAHKRFGSLPWADLLAPAIRAAEEGFAVDESYMASARDALDWFDEDPARRDRNAFLWSRFLRDGAVALGDVIRNPEQARALRLIAQRGPSAFYEGPIAEAIVRAARNAAGVITAADLHGYRAREESPISGSFLGRTVVVMPPPSSGGIATLQVLGTIERHAEIIGTSIDALGHNSPAYIHTLAEAFKHAFADRAAHLGDAAFVDVPVARLLDPLTIDSFAERIDPTATGPLKSYGSAPGETAAPPDDAGTSHFSVIDSRGMAVACTETINLTFGSRVAVEEFGFFLNNEMDDFTTVPGGVNAFGLRQSDLNLPAAGKRPLSSMSPTIVLDTAGRVELVTGAAGGPRIITGTIQTILNVLAFGMDAGVAVSAPRVHHQGFPPVLALEGALGDPDGTDADASPDGVMRLIAEVNESRARLAALESRGHRVGTIGNVGVAQIVVRAGDGYAAASDPRRGGAPAGVACDGSVAVDR